MQKNNLKGKAKNIADILLQDKLITQDQFAVIQDESMQTRKTIGEVVKEKGFVSEEELAESYGKLLNIPYVDLKRKKISPSVLHEIPKSTILNYQIVPFEKHEHTLKIAMVDPENFRAIEALDFITQSKRLETEIYIITKKDFDEVLQSDDTMKEELGKALEDVSELAHEEGIDDKLDEITKDEELAQLVQEAPITKALSIIIKHAVKQGSSDIHIEPKGDTVRIRYRIDGILQTRISLPEKLRSALISRVKVLANLRLDEHRIPQDGRFHLQMENHPIDFRVSTFPTVDGEKVVLRILDKSTGILSLDDLGLEGQRLEDVTTNIKHPQGMFLVTGPTGSGKSTTLYSILSTVNNVGVNVVTLEDPVEYFIEGVNQAQINPSIGFDFASGLRSILRQDPDVILVGEIRDSETAKMAVHSALTGHSVLTTLHTNSAAGAIPRLIDMGVEPFLLISCINIVVAQRLIRKICTNCKIEHDIPDNIKQKITSALQGVKEAEKYLSAGTMKVFKGKGCSECNGSGYKGRMGIFESIPMTDKLQSIIVEKPSAQAIRRLVEESGLLSITQDGYLKVLRGLTTPEEILRVISE